AMRSFAAPPGLLPEQVWDGPPIPDRELTPGGPTGSAMPLVWAHAEYVRLMASLRLGRVFDTPVEAAERYRDQTPPPRVASWAPHHKLASMTAGKLLRLDLGAPSTIRWSADAWKSFADIDTTPMIGVHTAVIPTAPMAPGAQVVFTIRQGDRWEGTNYAVDIA
ncbi:MAG: glucan 1,4-alpha-glucosidase, partial [Acidimicrobiia bacterium]